MRIAVAVLAILLPVLTACSAPGPGTGPAATPSASATASEAPATPEPDLTSAPTTPPVGQLLTLDKAADYPDGLSIQVDNVVATTAADGVDGAQGTSGQVVLADVVVTNHSRSDFDATTVVVQGYYRGNVGAVMLTDANGTLGTGFSEAVPRGEQHKARVGFAVPAADAGDVTIVVDPHDGTHDPVRFQGPALGD
ncbi:hypothetical protein [Raineyella antarctica]|nr:hypothetical protein [Raineyella antarctica]